MEALNMEIDPKQFGLTLRTRLKAIDSNHIAIVVDRKSRIIMSDGEKILLKAGKIKKVQEKVNIILETSAPVCSKTANLLSENDIDIRKISQR